MSRLVGVPGPRLVASNSSLIKKGIIGIVVFWFMTTAVTIGLSLGVIYVAWHFISKLW